MATASILSRITAPVVKADTSRDDLAVNDVVELEFGYIVQPNN